MQTVSSAAYQIVENERQTFLYDQVCYRKKNGFSNELNVQTQNQTNIIV